MEKSEIQHKTFSAALSYATSSLSLRFDNMWLPNLELLQQKTQVETCIHVVIPQCCDRQI